MATHGGLRWTKLTTEAVREMRERYATGAYTLDTLGAEYEVHYSTVYSALRGHTWASNYPDELREQVQMVMTAHRSTILRSAPPPQAHRKRIEKMILAKKEAKRLDHTIKSSSLGLEDEVDTDE